MTDGEEQRARVPAHLNEPSRNLAENVDGLHHDSPESSELPLPGDEDPGSTSEGIVDSGEDCVPDHQGCRVFNLKLFYQFLQAFIIFLVRLIAEGNPLSLHELGFSQMDVRHQHGIQGGEEEDPLRMKTDFLTMQGCF